MCPELDLSRLTELQQVLGSALPELITKLVSEVDDAIVEIEAGFAAGDLDRTALAAHAARNSALILGTGPVLKALAEVESGSRAGDRELEKGGLEQLRSAWPPVRRLLEQEAARHSR